MGWDDNGLPTERRVQNYYGVRCDPALPYDAGFTPAGEAGRQEPARLRRQSAPQLHRALRGARRRGREGLRDTCAAPSACRVDWDLTYRTIDDKSRAISPAGVPAQLRPRRGLPGRGAHPVGRHLPTAVAQAELEDRESPAHYHRVAVPPARRRADLHRDHPPRADRRRASRWSRTPTTSGTSRCSAPRSPRRCSASRCRCWPTALGRAGQGLRHRHVLHLRRPHRRHLVARAAAADPRDRRPRRPHASARPRTGSRPRTAAAAYEAIAGQDGLQRQGRRGGAARASRRLLDGEPKQIMHPVELLREGRQAPRGRHLPPVVHPQRRPRRGPPRAR